MANRRIPALTWHERVTQWRNSGMPAREYAEQQGFPLERLTYWVRHVERESQGPQLLPVHVQVPPTVPAMLELRSPSGWTMRVGAGTDPAWLAMALVDMRTSIDGLSLHVQRVLGRPPCVGTAYIFNNRRRTRLKVACWDGNGVWMCLRWLHRGQFVWPETGNTSWQVSAEQWQWLVMGVDWQRLLALAPAQCRL